MGKRFHALEAVRIPWIGLPGCPLDDGTALTKIAYFIPSKTEVQTQPLRDKQLIHGMNR